MIPVVLDADSDEVRLRFIATKERLYDIPGDAPSLVGWSLKHRNILKKYDDQDVDIPNEFIDQCNAYVNSEEANPKTTARAYEAEEALKIDLKARGKPAPRRNPKYMPTQDERANVANMEKIYQIARRLLVAELTGKIIHTLDDLRTWSRKDYRRHQEQHMFEDLAPRHVEVAKSMLDDESTLQWQESSDADTM